MYKDKKNLDKFFGYLSFKMNCAYVAEHVGWKLDVDLAESSIEKLKEQQDTKVKSYVKLCLCVRLCPSRQSQRYASRKMALCLLMVSVGTIYYHNMDYPKTMRVM